MRLPFIKLSVAGALLVAGAIWWTRAPSFDSIRNLDAPGELVAVLGDSIPAGHSAGAENAWPALVSRELGFPLLNASVSGDTTAGGLARLEREVLAHSPRVVIVELGGNDFLRRLAPAQMAENLRSIFTRIHDSGALAVFVGVPTPLGGDYQRVFEEVSGELGVHYVPDVLDGIAFDNALMADPIHPNAEGHRRIAERLAPELSRLLKAADAARSGS